MKKQRDRINVQDHILPDGSMSPELLDFLRGARAEMEASAVDHKQPPWKAFPKYEMGSMGWRMGAGEDYWYRFHDWIGSLDKREVEEFISAFPEPEHWVGFYDTLGFDL